MMFDGALTVKDVDFFVPEFHVTLCYNILICECYNFSLPLRKIVAEIKHHLCHVVTKLFQH